MTDLEQQLAATLQREQATLSTWQQVHAQVFELEHQLQELQHQEATAYEAYQEVLTQRTRLEARIYTQLLVRARG